MEKAMKKTIVAGILVYAIFALLNACVSTGRGTALSLQEAIERSAEKMASELPRGSRVAIVAFESANDNFSNYIMEELTGALFDSGIEVADRRNLPYVFQELNFQMSGAVSDETAKSVGKFIGADMVITGDLTNFANLYRYRTSAVNVETAIRTSVTRLDVRNDQTMRNMVASLALQETTVTVTRYGVSEDRTPQTAGAYLDRGLIYARRGEYEKAIADYDNALRLKPGMSAADMLRERALIEQLIITGELVAAIGKYDDAIESFTLAIQMDPSFAPAYSKRGLAYYNKREYAQSISDFTKAIDLERRPPNLARDYYNRGNAHYGMSSFDYAIIDYNLALRLDPNLALVYLNRGNAYGIKKDYNRAISDYSQAIRLDPNLTSAYFNRGVTYYSNNEIDKAIADWEALLRIDPNHVNARQNLESAQKVQRPTTSIQFLERGNTYFNRGDYDQAITDYTQVIRNNPNSPEPYFNRGLAYRRKGDNDLAIADFTQVIQLDNSAGAYYNRGHAYASKGDFDRAIADFTQVITVNPNNAETFYYRGLMYADKRDFDRAIADLEAVLRINPNHAEAKQAIVRVRKDRGY